MLLAELAVSTNPGILEPLCKCLSGCVMFVPSTPAWDSGVNPLPFVVLQKSLWELKYAQLRSE